MGSQYVYLKSHFQLLLGRKAASMQHILQSTENGDFSFCRAGPTNRIIPGTGLNAGFLLVGTDVAWAWPANRKPSGPSMTSYPGDRGPTCLILPLTPEQ